ncbi:MAG: Fic family protein [Planctomycetota bacterium]
MRIGDFRSSAEGEIVQIPSFLGTESAFVPRPLPPAWRFGEQLWPLLNEAGNRLHRLDGIGRTLPNPALLLRPLRDREAILSSRMEGTFATPRELLLFEQDPADPSEDNDARNQHREVANYARALDAATRSSHPLGLHLVRQMHAELMHGVRGEDKRPGEIRTGQVGIGRLGKKPRFVPPPPEHLAGCLEDLDTYLSRDEWTYERLVECFVVHYQFEAIHPFSDGNGRVGRLLLTLMVQRLHGMPNPWLHMSEFFEQDHEHYCNLLYRISTRGEWENWIAYCLEGVAWLAERTADRCNRLLNLRGDFQSRLQQLRNNARLSQVVENLFQHPLLSVVELQRTLGVTYPTAKSDLEKLVKIDVLAEFDDHRPKTFYAPEIFAIAYEGLE